MSVNRTVARSLINDSTLRNLNETPIMKGVLETTLGGTKSALDGELLARARAAQAKLLAGATDPEAMARAELRLSRDASRLPNADELRAAGINLRQPLLMIASTIPTAELQAFVTLAAERAAQDQDFGRLLGLVEAARHLSVLDVFAPEFDAQARSQPVYQGAAPKLNASLVRGASELLRATIPALTSTLTESLMAQTDHLYAKMEISGPVEQTRLIKAIAQVQGAHANLISALNARTSAPTDPVALDHLSTSLSEAAAAAMAAQNVLEPTPSPLLPLALMATEKKARSIPEPFSVPDGHADRNMSAYVIKLNTGDRFLAVGRYMEAHLAIRSAVEAKYGRDSIADFEWCGEAKVTADGVVPWVDAGNETSGENYERTSTKVWFRARTAENREAARIDLGLSTEEAAFPENQARIESESRKRSLRKAEDGEFSAATGAALKATNDVGHLVRALREGAADRIDPAAQAGTERFAHYEKATEHLEPRLNGFDVDYKHEARDAYVAIANALSLAVQLANLNRSAEIPSVTGRFVEREGNPERSKRLDRLINHLALVQDYQLHLPELDMTWMRAQLDNFLSKRPVDDYRKFDACMRFLCNFSQQDLVQVGHQALGELAAGRFAETSRLVDCLRCLAGMEEFAGLKLPAGLDLGRFQTSVDALSKEQVIPAAELEFIRSQAKLLCGYFDKRFTDMCERSVQLIPLN